MTTPVVLGIRCEDAASRLVAADAAEERCLTDLAAALRDLRKPLVLERTDPPQLIPEWSEWALYPRRSKAPRLPAGTVMLRHLNQRNAHTIRLHFTCRRCYPPGFPEGIRFPRSIMLVRTRLDDIFGDREYGPDPPTVARGLILVETHVPDDWDAANHVHPSDAWRFGFTTVLNYE